MSKKCAARAAALRGYLRNVSRMSSAQPISAAPGATFSRLVTAIQDEWLWGWDPTPGIVSVWANGEGHATVWRRDPESRTLLCEEARFRPWLLLASLADLQHL